MSHKRKRSGDVCQLFLTFVVNTELTNYQHQKATSGHKKDQKCSEVILYITQESRKIRISSNVAKELRL